MVRPGAAAAGRPARRWRDCSAAALLLGPGTQHVPGPHGRVKRDLHPGHRHPPPLPLSRRPRLSPAQPPQSARKPLAGGGVGVGAVAFRSRGADAQSATSTVGAGAALRPKGQKIVGHQGAGSQDSAADSAASAPPRTSVASPAWASTPSDVPPRIGRSQRGRGQDDVSRHRVRSHPAGPSPALVPAPASTGPERAHPPPARIPRAHLVGDLDDQVQPGPRSAAR